MNHKIGILLNTKSGRVRSNLVVYRQMLKQIKDASLYEISSLPELEEALGSLADSGINLLVIVAGDGTIHAVLTSLFNGGRFVPQPKLVLIPAGTTNMTAKDFGVYGSPMKHMKRLLKLSPGIVEDNLVTRPVLCVKRNNGDPLYGMFLGAGLIAEGVRYFNEHIKSTGITGEKASALVMLRYLISLFTTSDAKKNIQSEVCLEIENSQHYKGACLILLASTLNRLLLGSRPYWGEESRRIHFSFISRSPTGLWRKVLPILSGRARKLREEDGYISHNADLIFLKSDMDFIIDGEIYEAAENGGSITISANEQISVVNIV